jgi:signal transduction histidine kinase/ActR/RegA family two-component response regulator
VKDGSHFKVRRKPRARREAAVVAHLERIHALTEALSETLTPTGVAQAVCRHATLAVQADTCTLHLLVDRSHLALIGHVGVPAEIALAIGRIEASDVQNPVAQTLASNEILWAETPDEYARLFPRLFRQEATGPRASAFWCAPLAIGGRPIGALGMGFHRSCRFTRDDRALARTISHQCAVALERARVFAEAQANEQRLRFLAEASTVLGGSLDYQATLASVTRLAVPTVGDWAAVDMLQADGSFVRLAVAHVDPVKVKVAHELWARWPPRLRDESGIGRVARTGKAELHEEITDEMLDTGIADRALREVYRALGIRSAMSVPLVVRGRTVGVMTLVSAESGRRFGTSDLTLASDLAMRAGVAIENAQSFREAAEANRMKDEFLATMSHELRTPLGAILGWSSMLQKDVPDPSTLAKGLKTIERNARTQAKLIDDVLDVSRIITGKLRLDPKPMDPKATLAAALEVVRPAAEAKGVQIVTSVEDEPIPTFADSDRIQQIIWNLLSNSVKFTARGGTVRVTLGRDHSAIRLQVTDNGQGIAPEFLPFIFDRFRQADSSTTRRHAGLGLGLAIARHLAEIHGGTIVAESAGEGTGSTFTVTLPMRVLRLPPAEAAPHEVREDGRRSRAGPADLSGLRVLVCDDDPDTREIVAHVLEEAGAAVSLADCARDALDMVRAGALDVLVSDIGMPHVDGYALMRQIRNLAPAEGGELPALALTAYVRAEDVRRAIASGFQTHVAKPVDPRELVARVAALGRRRPARRGVSADEP